MTSVCDEALRRIFPVVPCREYDPVRIVVKKRTEMLYHSVSAESNKNYRGSTMQWRMRRSYVPVYYDALETSGRSWRWEMECARIGIFVAYHRNPKRQHRTSKSGLDSPPNCNVLWWQSSHVTSNARGRKPQFTQISLIIACKWYYLKHDIPSNSLLCVGRDT